MKRNFRHLLALAILASCASENMAMQGLHPEQILRAMGDPDVIALKKAIDADNPLQTAQIADKLRAKNKLATIQIPRSIEMEVGHLTVRPAQGDAQTKQGAAVIFDGRIVPALTYAVLKEKATAAQVLLTYHDIDPNQTERLLGATALHFATQLNHIELMQALLARHGTDPSKGATPQGNMTPLHLAAGQDMLDATQLLLRYGANANAQTDDGTTPLHKIALAEKPQHREEIAQLLFKYGARTDLRTAKNDTVEHYACMCLNNRASFLQVLAKHDPQSITRIFTAKNELGQTPFEFAEELHNYKPMDTYPYLESVRPANLEQGENDEV